MSKPDTAAILKLFLERGDCLDASSYDVQQLCGRVEELEAEAIASKQLLDSIAAALLGKTGHGWTYTPHTLAPEIAEMRGRLTAARALLTEAADALAGSRCHWCLGQHDLTVGGYLGCRVCRPTRELLVRLRSKNA